MLRVYLRIDGEEFDPAAFQAAAGGSVEPFFRMDAGVRKVTGQFWKSPEVSNLLSQDVDAALFDLLCEFTPAIESLNATEVCVSAEVVQLIDETGDVCGALFTARTLQLLAKVGGSLDVDPSRSVRA